MASSSEFVEYICEQLSEGGSITYKKMFGDYGVYCNGKIIGLICDNQLFVKKTVSGEAVLKRAEDIIGEIKEASPYSGAKLHFLIDSFEDKMLMGEFIQETYNELPIPKPKKKKK